MSLINTNVTRSGEDYDANVTAALWDFYDKKNTWNVNGQVGVSQLIGYENPGKIVTGYNHAFRFGKRSGRFNFNLWQELADNKYNHNDLGYFTNNNYFNNGLWMSYRWLQPKKWYNRIQVNMNMNYSMRFKPMDYQSFNFNINANSQLKNLWFVGFNINFSPEQNDFFEPRINGKVFKRPGARGMGLWVETNEAKKYSTNFEFFTRTFNQYKSSFNEISVRHNYRFNKKLTLSLNSSVLIFSNNLGYATMFNTDSIIFALRKRNTVENIFNAKYNFNNKMGLAFRARHYWSKVANNEFFSLRKDGYLNPIVGGISRNVDFNVNYFNIDMVYTWQFALGSFINVVWKDAISTFNRDVNTSYFKNFGNTINADQQNSLSIRVIYFLDYLNLKKKS